MKIHTATHNILSIFCFTYSQKPVLVPLEEKNRELQINPDGLLYTSVDFTGVAPSSSAPSKPPPSDIVYSEVNFTKHPQ